MNFQTMSKQRKFVLIAAAIGVISTFLPWWSISVFGYTSSVNGFHGMGILAFLCFAGAGVMAYLDDQTTNLDKAKWTATLIAGAVAALIVIWYIIDASSSAFGSYLGFGIYLAALAGIGIVLAAFIYRTPGDTFKDGFDNLKKGIGSRMNSTSSATNDSSSSGNINSGTTTGSHTSTGSNTENTSPPL